MIAEHEILPNAYRDFNARNIEAVISRMHPQVEWANGMEGGHVHGKDEVRAYWTRQFTSLNPQVEPVSYRPRKDAKLGGRRFTRLSHDHKRQPAARHYRLPYVPISRWSYRPDGHSARERADRSKP